MLQTKQPHNQHNHCQHGRFATALAIDLVFLTRAENALILSEG
jgi:hypothetical protein